MNAIVKAMPRGGVDRALASEMLPTPDRRVDV
jgi:hypothetical protein